MTDAVRPGCEPVLADISAYLDGELGAPACERIEHHCHRVAAVGRGGEHIDLLKRA